MLLHRLCYGRKCCLILSALCQRAQVTAKILNFGVERSKNVHGERISNKYFNQILQRNSTYVPMVHWWMLANPDRKKCVGIKIVSAQRGNFGQKWWHLAVRATCRQHVGNFLSQAGYLLGDEDPEHLVIARHCLSDSVPPNEVKFFRIDNVL